MKFTTDQFNWLNQRFNQGMERRSAMLPVWRDLAEFFLPVRYTWLEQENLHHQPKMEPPEKILDPTGTFALRILAAGLMNGITSPARQWFKLGIDGSVEELSYESRIWLAETEQRMLKAAAGTNLYNGFATNYLDISLFGTTAHLIYPNFDNVFRSYVPAMGEYWLGASEQGTVDTFGREFLMSPYQIKVRWGEENMSPQLAAKLKQAQANIPNIKVRHLIEPNRDDKLKRGNLPFRELYWEATQKEPREQKILKWTGHRELPGFFARWETLGNSPYGSSSPCLDALGDVKQLQHETMRKAQGMDKLVNPPMVADMFMRNTPTSFMPNSVTYAPGNSQIGVRSAYDLRLPLGEMTADIRDIQTRIRESLYNSLFQMISQLNTVRSATEIEAREEEKLALLGPMLERFENEALDPAIGRIYNIMLQKDLFGEPPAELRGANIKIRYVSILALAQASLATVPMERFLQFVGGIAPLYPQAVNLPNWDDMIRGYATSLGLNPSNVNEPDTTAQLNQQDEQLIESREAAATGKDLVDSAQQLSQTDVGGGVNALQRLLS